MAKVVSIKRTVWDQLYLPSVVNGLSITLKHFFANTFGAPLGMSKIETIRYGEPYIANKSIAQLEREGSKWRGKAKFRDVPERFRGRHRLMKRDDGSVRCTACMMCATACPANCIHIEAGERDGSKTEKGESRSIEKYPVRFEIDELVCVVCGLCVEACPCDAIRMDTHERVKPVEHRYSAVFDKEKLMSRGELSLALDGGAGPTWERQYAQLGDTRQIYRPEHLHKDRLGYRNPDAKPKEDTDHH